MTTSETRKEEISKRFIELIAATEGYTTSIPNPDHGVDLVVKEVGYRITDDKTRHYETGRRIEIQIKATTIKSINNDEKVIRFDLKSKNYNDLIERKKAKTPLLQSYLKIQILGLKSHQKS